MLENRLLEFDPGKKRVEKKRLDKMHFSKKRHSIHFYHTLVSKENWFLMFDTSITSVMGVFPSFIYSWSHFITLI